MADPVMHYEPNAKPKEPWQRGRRGSLCPTDVDLERAHQLLESSELVDGSRYAVHDGRAYCAQGDDTHGWHGYPIGWKDTPETLRWKWLRAGRLRRTDIRRHWDE